MREKERESLLSLCVCAQTTVCRKKDGFPRIFSGAGGAYVLQHLFYVPKTATDSHRLQIRANLATVPSLKEQKNK